MTTIVTRAGKGSSLTWVEADANFTNLNSTKLENIVEDLSPQLGANLDINGYSIVSVSNGNINITPNGTGVVSIKGVKVGPGAGSIASNTAVGTTALSSNTTGAHNTTIGAGGLQNNTSGSYNTSIGEFSAFGNTNANNNTSLGYGTLYRNANSANNTAVGTAALNNTVGANNTAVGKDAGKILDTGADNVFIGYLSGSAITTGSNNVILGNNTGSSIATSSNNIIIADGQGNIRISVNSSGAVKLGTLTYPTADGTNGQAIITNGSGTLSFGTFLTSYTETDPIFVASAAYNITGTQITNWDSAYGWGNYASAIGTTIQGYSANLAAWSSLATNTKQDTLISGTSIKTVNSTSILGSGNISLQDTLVSGTNIKTVNGNDLLGAGNIVISSGQGLGSIVAYKADGSQDNIDITANTTLTQIGVTQELLLDASSLIAIETTSSYGWRDNIAQFVVKSTSGTGNPSWGTLWSGFEGLVFSATAMNQVWVDFHVDHDYALGTTLYPHVHWTPTTTGTGVVRWGIEYSVAKGHQQVSGSVFPASTTVYVEQTISTASQWMHFVAEVSDANAIPSTNVEPDTVIKIRIFRDAAHANDTYAGTVHAWQADLHYKSNRFATLNKAPNFNA